MTPLRHHNGFSALTDADDRRRVALIVAIAVALSTAFAAAGILRVVLAAA